MVSWPAFPLASLLRNLDSTDTRCVLVLSQIKQHFAETLLARSASTTSGALAGDINQFGNTLPAGTTCRSILSVGKELLSICTCLAAKLVGLVVVGNVEVVNVLAGLLDCRFLLLVRNLCAVGNVCVSSLAPLSIVIQLTQGQGHKTAWEHQTYWLTWRARVPPLVLGS